ncbi:hypothetical protein ATN84_21215 [Paramesorhizobium deserti]|uniref:HTH lysR-type domain-containing protein n=1 Tax=Paramesorhizobium deserti TaxID=1494590 RepID=A0A135HPP6_9HYPH|nr:LysR family transcriptional regulator [Paramesorhizobium deserti]KXF75188.1 hypothetical protein ATN84_21215 [Paramesorhizobium deserti]
MSMRLEWLEDILAVAETGSFSEAAERRRLTQSAFSRRIQQIEDYVGVELFDRRCKPVHLRPTTENQREQIAQLISLLRQLIVDLKRGAQTSANRIVLASQHALTATLTPSLIEKAQAYQPDTFVKIRSANLDECLALLLSRQVAIAILYRLPGTDHPVRPDFVETVTIGTDRLIPTIAARQVDWLNRHLMLNELPYVAYPTEVFLGWVMERLVLSHLRQEFQLQPKAETALTLAALEMAMTGIVVAWLPLSLVRRRIADGTLVDLSDRLPGCGLEVTAVRLVGTSEALEQWVWSQIALLPARDQINSEVQ